MVGSESFLARRRGVAIAPRYSRGLSGPTGDCARRPRRPPRGTRRARRDPRACAVPPRSTPPGEVTWARSSSGDSPVGEQRRRSLEGPHDELARDVARESLVHAGLDERLDDQVEVRGHRARQAGHRVDVALGDAHDRAHGAEDRLGPVEVVLGDVRAARDGADALARSAPACWASSARPRRGPGRPPRCARSTAPPRPTAVGRTPAIAAHSRAAPSAWSGFTQSTTPVSGPTCSSSSDASTATPGSALRRGPRAARATSRRRQSRSGAHHWAAKKALGERRAHAAAADDYQFKCHVSTLQGRSLSSGGDAGRAPASPIDIAVGKISST